MHKPDTCRYTKTCTHCGFKVDAAIHSWGDVSAPSGSDLRMTPDTCPCCCMAESLRIQGVPMVLINEITKDKLRAQVYQNRYNELLRAARNYKRAWLASKDYSASRLASVTLDTPRCREDLFALADLPQPDIRRYTPEGEDLILKLDGQTFRCDCGSNVFKKAKESADVRLCNGCRAVYVVTDPT